MHMRSVTSYGGVPKCETQSEVILELDMGMLPKKTNEARGL